MAILFPQMHPMFNDPNRWMPLPSNYQAPPTPPTSGFDGYIPGPVPGDIPGGGGGGDGRIFPPGPYRPGPFDPDEELPPAEPPPPPPPPPMADNYGFGSAGAGDVGEALGDPYSGIGPGTFGLLGPSTFSLRDIPGIPNVVMGLLDDRIRDQDNYMNALVGALKGLGVAEPTTTQGIPPGIMQEAHALASGVFGPTSPWGGAFPWGGLPTPQPSVTPSAPPIRQGPVRAVRSGHIPTANANVGTVTPAIMAEASRGAQAMSGDMGWSYSGGFEDYY